MAQKLNDVGTADLEYWRERAREVRAKSVARGDVEGKCAFRHIAERYEEPARQAESVRKTHATPIEP